MLKRGWQPPPLTDSLGRTRGGRWRGRHEIPAKAHPFVRRLFEIVNSEGATLEEVARRAGISRQTINSWRSRKSPQLVALEAVLGAVGYRLRVERVPDDA